MGEYAGGGRFGIFGQERLISIARGKGQDGEVENVWMRLWQVDISAGEPVTLMMIVLGGVEEVVTVDAKEEMMERYWDRGRGLYPSVLSVATGGTFAAPSLTLDSESSGGPEKVPAVGFPVAGSKKA